MLMLLQILQNKAVTPLHKAVTPLHKAVTLHSIPCAQFNSKSYT